MRQFWVVTGICLMIISLVKATDPPPIELTINKIERLADTVGAPTFNVCYNENEPNGTTLYTLIIKSGTSEPLESTDTHASESCVTFPGDITKFSNTDANFLLNALAAEGEPPLAAGQAAFDNFPVFPGVLNTSNSADPLDNKTFILRVSGDMQGMTFTDISETPITSGKTSYFLGVDAIPTTLQPCIKVTPDNISVCDVPATNPDVINAIGPKVTSGLLSYGYNDGNSNVSAKLEFEVSSVVPVAKKNTPSDKFDIILPDKLCPLLDIGKGECEINWAGPGKEIADIRLVGVLGDVMQEATLNSIPDRELVGEIIGKDTYEARWLILLDSPNSDDKHYMLTKRSFPVDTDNETVYVDCSETTLHHCFGYFPGITVGTYRITVQDHKKPDEYNADKKIQSKPFTIGTPTLLGLEIKQLSFDWHQNDIEVNASVCFYHIITPDVESVFSHYEILIINGKGQWLKDKLTTHGTVEGDLCFTPLTINTEAFDVTEGAKVIVTQRAIDGFSVLSSGETTLS